MSDWFASVVWVCQYVDVCFSIYDYVWWHAEAVVIESLFRKVVLLIWRQKLKKERGGGERSVNI